jgi:DNA-directed RNA polymerase subunit RPC12/RpoP
MGTVRERAKVSTTSATEYKCHDCGQLLKLPEHSNTWTDMKGNYWCEPCFRKGKPGLKHRLWEDYIKKLEENTP